MSLNDVERGFRALLLHESPTLFAGVDEGRQRAYRELVRNNLRGTLDRACPHARRLFTDAFDALTSRWLAEAPPTTRLLRDVPSAFAAWLATLPPSSLPHPAFAELCHFEAVEIEVVLAETTVHGAAPMKDASQVVFDTSLRIGVYLHAVHRVRSTTTELPASSPVPHVVVCFQRAEAFEVRPVSPAVGKVLMITSQGAAVGAAIDAVVAEAVGAGVSVDVGRLKSDLVDLQRRGAISFS